MLETKPTPIPPSISKNPPLRSSEDFYGLRRKGVELIAQMASSAWTDYNAHDPGITLLEALCFALTDLSYRAGWDIKDLLAQADNEAYDPDVQALFSAREILTINPLTIDDYRRLLIDCEQVANAWLIARQCGCETPIFADCRHSRLGYLPAEDGEVPVNPRGLYDVLLQLEHDPELGDLNDRKIQHSFILKLDNRPTPINIELYFPEWDNAAWGEISEYYDADQQQWLIALDKVTIKATLSTDGSEASLSQPQQIQRWQQWQRVFYADLTLKFANGTDIKLNNLALRLFGSNDAQRRFQVDWQLSNLVNFNDELQQAVAAVYLQKIAARQQRVEQIRQKLLSHRNLCEDFCRINTVGVQDVAVCADIDVSQDADIEQILAQVLWAIEQYFNPRIAFYSLQERLQQGLTVDAIFDGPALQHGFVDADNLAAAQLKNQIRTSDIINLLVDIPGVIAVRSLLLTRYDDQGQAVAGVADIGPNSDPHRTAAQWTLQIDERHQPRLHTNQSKWLFYKNDLPFSPKASEVQDSLSQLRGQHERLKLRSLTEAELDLPVPQGQYRQVKDYQPVQNSLPLCYGVSLEGLPPAASELRKAQAKQLKAYLLVFEQLLSNAEAQIADVGRLFSLDEQNQHTYFFQLLDESRIADLPLLLNSSLSPERLQALIESDAERLQRRNRFLDHMLARFAESFSDYALALYSSDRNAQALSQQQLIRHKIAFLKHYPYLSSNRDRSFNYSQPLSADNALALRERLALLLGLSEQQAEHILLIEHLLLRPKFPGDALMQVCIDPKCALSCSDGADPYSFQVTVVMPGWLAPFNENIDLRRFADQTLMRELPAHVLAKICWVSNWDYGEDWRDDFVRQLASYLQANGKNSGGASPSSTSALQGANALYDAALSIFKNWIKSQSQPINPANSTTAVFNALLKEQLGDLGNHYSFIKNYDSLATEILQRLSAYLQRMAQADRWHHFDRIKQAWQHWLSLNSAFNSAQTAFVDKLDRTLYLLNVARSNAETRHQKACALSRLFGEAWLAMLPDCAAHTATPASERVAKLFEQVFGGQKLADAGVAQKHFAALSSRFVELYGPWLPVSCALWQLLAQLQQTHNSYPEATLHDCDEGGDRNPVRLGSTALGG